MPIIGVELVKDGPGHWQDSVDDIMGRSDSIKDRRDHPLRRHQSTISSIESIIPKLEILLQDAEEYVESIANIGGVSDSDPMEKRKKFEIYSGILTISNAIFNEWASILKYITDDPSKAAEEPGLGSKISKFGVLFDFLSVYFTDTLPKNDLAQSERDLWAFFPDYYDRLKFDGRKTILLDTYNFIESNIPEAVDDPDSSDIVNTEKQSSTMEDLIRKNLIPIIVEGKDVFMVEIKITIEGEAVVDSNGVKSLTERKNPEALKVGSFLHSFSSALTAIDGVNVYISNVENGSVIATLQVQLANEKATAEFVETMDLITGSRQPEARPIEIEIADESNAIVDNIDSDDKIFSNINQLLSGNTQQLDPAIKALAIQVLNATIEEKRWKTEVLKRQAEHLMHQSELRKWEKIDYINRIVKPNIKVQGKLSIEIGGIKCDMSVDEKEDEDPKVLL